MEICLYCVVINFEIYFHLTAKIYVLTVLKFQNKIYVEHPKYFCKFSDVLLNY